MSVIGRYLNVGVLVPYLGLLVGLGMSVGQPALAVAASPTGIPKTVAAGRPACTALENVELSAATLYSGTTSLSLFFASGVSVDAKTTPGLIILQAGKGEVDLHFQAKANALYVVTVFTREGAPLDYTLTTVGVVSKGATQAAGKGIALIPVSTTDAGDVLLDITGDKDTDWPLYKIDLIQVQ